MKVWIFLFLWLIPSMSYASTYWVSPNGTNSWANCKGSVPLNDTSNPVACSLATANANAQAGDIVNIRGGSYSNGQLLIPSQSGSAGNPITFTAYNNEDVEMTSEFIPNGSMETSAWAPSNGAVASQSNAEAWDGSYSTKFTTTTAGQGIQSGAFTLPGPYGSTGYNFYACVYSNQSLVHLHITNGTGGTLKDEDVSLYPNLWTCFSTAYMGSSGQAGTQANILFTSPASIPAGSWYIDDVRMHSYEDMISLNGKTYIRILGLHISNADAGFIMQNGSSYNEVANSTFTNLDAYSPGVITGPNGTTPSPGSQYNWVHDNVFHDNGSVVAAGSNSCQENGDQLRLGETNIDDSSSYNLVENNTFYHSVHDHMLVSTKYNTIRNNVFHNETWTPNHYAIVTKYTFEDAFSTQPASYGDAIFTWLQQNNYLDPVGHVNSTWEIDINTPGKNYQVGDVLRIVGVNVFNGFVVTGVNGTGAITNFVPNYTTTGLGYKASNNISLFYGHGSGGTINIVDGISAKFTDPGEAAAILSVLNGYNSCGLENPAPSLAGFIINFGSSVGTNIFNWLVANNIINSSSQVIADITSPAVLASIQAQFTTVQYRTIISILNDNKLSGRNLLFQQPLASPDNDAGYNLVEGNRLGNAGTPITEGANDIENSTDGNIIRFNYFFSADAAGLYWKPTVGGSPHFASYNHIFNNTFYANGGGVAINPVHQGGLGLNINSSSSTDPENPVGNIMINNLLYGSNPAAYGGDGPAQFESQNTFTNNDITNNPIFTNPDLSNPYSLTLPDLSLQSTSPDINQGIALTTVAGTDTGSGTTLVVNDASFFQDGTWAPPGHLQADWIAVTNVSNTVQISSINYSTNTIILTQSINRSPGDSIWLYKNSSGQQVLLGSAPDIGAYEFGNAVVQPVVYGDANGDGVVTIADAEMTAKAALGISVANFVPANAEVDGKSTVDIYDAFLIAEYVAGLISKFPVQP